MKSERLDAVCKAISEALDELKIDFDIYEDDAFTNFALGMFPIGELDQSLSIIVLNDLMTVKIRSDGYFDFPKEMLTEGAIAASYLNTVSSCTVEYTHYSGAIGYSYTLPCNGDYFTKELVTDALSMLTSVINEFHPYLKKLASGECTLDEFLDNLGI